MPAALLAIGNAVSRRHSLDLPAGSPHSGHVLRAGQQADVGDRIAVQRDHVGVVSGLEPAMRKAYTWVLSSYLLPQFGTSAGTRSSALAPVR